MRTKLVCGILLLSIVSTPCFAATCSQCGRNVRRFGEDVCGSCQSKNNASARESSNAAMGLGVALIGGMMQAAEKQREAEERAAAKREAEKKLAIEKANKQIEQDTIRLQLLDPSEGRHNLTIPVRPVHTAQSIQYWVGKNKEGAIELLKLPPSFFVMPAEFNLVRASLTNMVDISVYRQTSHNASGKWTIKNIPLKFFYRNSQQITVITTLVDDDELTFVMKNKENEELCKATLAINEPFDYSEEAGVDGKGFKSSTVRLESVPSAPQKKKRTLRW